MTLLLSALRIVTKPAAAAPTRRVLPPGRSDVRRTTLQRGALVLGVDLNPLGQVVGVWGGGTLVPGASLNPIPYTTVSFKAPIGGGEFNVPLYPEIDLAVLIERGPNFGELEALVAHRQNLLRSLSSMDSALSALEAQKAVIAQWRREVGIKIKELPAPYEQQIAALGQIRLAVLEFLSGAEEAEAEAREALAALAKESSERKEGEGRSDFIQRQRALSQKRTEIEGALLAKITNLEEQCRLKAQPKSQMLQYPLSVDRLMSMAEQALISLMEERIARLQHDLKEKLEQPVVLIRRFGEETITVNVKLSEEEQKLTRELETIEERLQALREHRRETGEYLKRLIEAAKTAREKAAEAYRVLCSPIPGTEPIVEKQGAEEGPSYYGLTFKGGGPQRKNEELIGHLDGDQEITLPGGKVKLAGIKAGASDVGPVTFYLDGTLKAGFLVEPAVYQDKNLRPGLFSVEPNGLLRFGLLAKEIELPGGIWVYGRIEYHEHGLPRTAVSARDQTIKKLPVKQGDRINFDRSGNPISVELAEGRRIGLRKYPRGSNVPLS